MVVARQYSDESEAYLDAGMLKNHGIEAVVQPYAMSQIFPAPGAGTGSILLYVPQNELKKALSLLDKNDGQ